MKTKHTPGPWVEDVDTHDEEGQLKEPVPNGYILGANGVPIAKVYGMANARLIAQAPTMLKGLKAAVAEFERIAYQKKCNPELLALLKKCIARAEGKE